MKIALQISGRLRFTDQSIGSIIGAIIEEWTPDVFCSFWEPENRHAIDKFRELIKPTSLEIEDQGLVRPYLDSIFKYNVHSNMPSMSYKFHRASCLRRSHELVSDSRYDCVIQARSDNLFFERLSPAHVSLPLSLPGIYCSNGAISTQIDPFISPRMVDNFYLGDSKSIDLAASCFWHLRQQAENYTAGGQLHHVRIPEIIQSKVWNDLGISIRTLPGESPAKNFYYDIDRRETVWK